MAFSLQFAESYEIEYIMTMLSVAFGGSFTIGDVRGCSFFLFLLRF